jgi:hypothetical protein
MPSEAFNARLEELVLQSTEESLRRSAADREAAEIARDTAKIWMELAKIKSEIDKLESEERLKITQMMHEGYREYQRPSRQLGVEIRHEDDLWIAELGGIKATGDTPAMAASEFDHIWVFGDV